MYKHLINLQYKERFVFSGLFFNKNLSFVLVVLLSSLGLATVAHAMEEDVPDNASHHSKKKELAEATEQWEELVKKIITWNEETREFQKEIGANVAYDASLEYYKENEFLGAIEHASLAMKAGHLNAKDLLSHALFKYGVELLKKERFFEALICFKRAKENNPPPYLQGDILIHLKHIGMHYYTTEQFSEAYQILRSVAKTPFSDLKETRSAAQITIAEMYYDGKGVSQSTSKALKWLKKAKENGNPKAQQKIDDILAAQARLN